MLPLANIELRGIDGKMDDIDTIRSDAVISLDVCLCRLRYGNDPSCRPEILRVPPSEPDAVSITVQIWEQFMIHVKSHGDVRNGDRKRGQVGGVEHRRGFGLCPEAE